MTRRKRRNHSAEFKVKVALAAIKVEYEQRDYLDEPWGLYDLVLDQLNELKKEVNENND